MKFANCVLRTGNRVLIGEASDGRYVNLTESVGPGVVSIRDLLELEGGILTRARAIIERAEHTVYPEDVHAFLPVAEADSKVFCVGLNYGGHAKELGVGIPKHPSIFSRYGTTCIGHEAEIQLPPSSNKVDWEGELALVVGKSIKYVGEGRALEAIAGATVFNDVSMRDFQERLPKITLAKNFDGSGPMGPWLVTSDEIPDYNDLSLVTRVNGEVKQNSSTKDFIFEIPYLVDLISQVCRLRPGDVIATGTPEGVGWAQKPEPRFLKDGDVVEVEIERVGTLRNTCRAEVV